MISPSEERTPPLTDRPYMRAADPPRVERRPSFTCPLPPTRPSLPIPPTPAIPSHPAQPVNPHTLCDRIPAHALQHHGAAGMAWRSFIGVSATGGRAGGFQPPIQYAEYPTH